VYHRLQEVEIASFSREAQLRVLPSEHIVWREDLEKQPSYSLLPSLNTLPGVRMEERSPGSYRLSIRGSLLRSPFGVRNVKIYLWDFPFTDAGGNTYLNSLDIGNINSIRVMKGPESSIFGANTGGALLIDPVYRTGDSLAIIADLSGGSYGLFHQNFLIQQLQGKSLFTVSQGYQRSDGYRENSAMQRHYIQLSETWGYRPGSQLKALILFSDLYYQTPGGLTLQQFEARPQQARPATAALPGTKEQSAAVYNKLLFGGVSHDALLTEAIRHSIALSASYNNFTNPFITNYEQRIETTLGGRTYLDGTLGRSGPVTAKWNVGGEWQQTSQAVLNYDNRFGTKDTLRVDDELKATQAFGFGRFLVDLYRRLLVEASLSCNFFMYDYKNNFPFSETGFHRRSFQPQWMPRLALSYKINPYLALKASASRGYSPPTLAEIRSSNNRVNTQLQAETGWSYESGIRLRDGEDYLWLEGNVFYFALDNAIVRRVNEDGTDYFINAGGTRQPGVEILLTMQVVKQRESGFIRMMELKGGVTRNWFSFSNYRIDTADYSGHALTGVPDYTSNESLYLQFPFRIGLFVQYYYAAAIPLNDAGTASAQPYQLVQVKTEWKKNLKRTLLTIYAGIDNLLNQAYSLGHDLNAAGGRYYNAAPPRNYYGGVKLVF
jgi:iron complex outermembrane receptor protein